MSPDELLQALGQRYGIEISRATLSRWAALGLIPAPRTGSGGRGRGRWSEYPRAAVHEAYATALMLEFGAPWGIVAGARRDLYRMARGAPPDPVPRDTISEMMLRTWAILAGRASAGVRGRTPVLVRLDGLDEDGCIRWRVEPAERTDFVV